MRSILWLGILAAVLCHPAFAGQSDRTMDQFAHTAWGTQDGAPSVITAIAQTTDGYLWLAGHEGLFRFDGMAFERYQTQSGDPLPAIGAVSLLALPNGDLWIGFRSGAISLLRNGTVTNFTPQDGLSPGHVWKLVQDRDGTIWAATTGGLERLEGKRWRQVGTDWNLPKDPELTAFVDHQGALWVSTTESLFLVPTGARQFQEIGLRLGSVCDVAQAANGKVWMAETTRSVRPVPLADKRLPADDTEVRLGSAAILFDKDGGFWITTLGDGLRHSSAPELLQGKIGKFSPAVDTFTTADGLSDDYVRSIFQDREGNIWVGTNGGLDRFRKTNLVPVVFPMKLKFTVSVLSAGDAENAWLASEYTLVRLHKGKAYAHPPLTGQAKVVSRDSTGAFWWFGWNAVYRSQGEGYSLIHYPRSFPKVYADAMASTGNSSGALWLAARREGLFYWKRGGPWEQVNAPSDLTNLTPAAAYTDWMGRAWVGYSDGTMVSLDHAIIQKIFPAHDSPVGGILAIKGRGRHIWIGGIRGLASFDGSRFQRIIPEDDESFKWIVGVEETSDGSLWLAEDRGVIQIPASEVQHALESASYRVKYRLFDSFDGLSSRFTGAESFQREVQATDGTLWFAAARGVVWVDPAKIITNTLPPPVVVRSLKANDRQVASLTNLVLPPGTTNLQIGYTALSLTVPEKVRYRYRLEEVDKGWQDAGTRREAFYNRLGPGRYHFRVIACNNDAVWNEYGARFEFRIAPAWFQTTWFRILCVGVFLLILWALYRFRLRQLERQFNLTLRTRLDERTRIARELHDTMLQSFQGLLLRFQTVSNLLPARPEDAKTRIDNVIEEGSNAITEGRDAIHEMRSMGLTTVHLDQLIGDLANELLGDLSAENLPEFRVQVEGTPKDLNPVVRDEVFRLAAEALRNAIRHAKASKIEVEIWYGQEDVKLRIRDDGKGVDTGVLKSGHFPGHWGLRGMRERADLIGARFEIASDLGSGTEIELKIPARSAYAKLPSSRRSFFAYLSDLTK